MSRDVVRIPQHMSLRAAALLLSRARVSGAPVVDGEGRCVGVLSTTDFMTWSARGCPAVGSHGGEPCVCDWEVGRFTTLPAEGVRSYMTADPVTAPPETPVPRLARMMIDAHIHRVIVVDERQQPVGVVSSTDLVAAVAYATQP